MSAQNCCFDPVLGIAHAAILLLYKNCDVTTYSSCVLTVNCNPNYTSNTAGINHLKIDNLRLKTYAEAAPFRQEA